MILDKNGRAYNAQYEPAPKRKEKPRTFEQWAKKHEAFTWKHQNSASMIPDKGFTKQLKKLSKHLEVIWDYGKHKWEIWDIRPDKIPYHVTTVQTKDKNYRELGADVLLQLQQFHPDRFKPGELISYFDEMDRQDQRRKAKEFSNKIESIYKDTFKYANDVLQVSVPKAIRAGRVVHV